MRVIPALGLSVALTLLMSGCRKQTGVDVEITTDVRCETTRMSTGVQLGELMGAEITGESPQVVTQACAEGAGGEPSRVGDIVVTASAGNDSATFRLTVMANLRVTDGNEAVSPEQCKAQNYVDCIVARRTLGFVPNEGLTLPIFLQNACASRICEEGTTCVADATYGVRCASSKIDQPKDCVSKPEGCVFSGPVVGPEDPTPPATLPAPPLYASTKDSFFKVDPESLSVGSAVHFKGCGDDKSIHDIAITNDNKLYAITTNALYEVKQDGTCSSIGGTMMVPVESGGYPYTLAVMPSGIIPNTMGDMLIGQRDNTFLAINPATGVVTPIPHSLPCPRASGDVIATKTTMGLNAYLAAQDGVDGNDYLAQINPVDGTPMEGAIPRSFGMKRVLGLAYWGGFFYGFAENGAIIKMAEKDGKIVNTPKPDPRFVFMGGASPADAPTSP